MSHSRAMAGSCHGCSDETSIRCISTESPGSLTSQTHQLALKPAHSGQTSSMADTPGAGPLSKPLHHLQTSICKALASPFDELTIKCSSILICILHWWQPMIHWEVVKAIPDYLLTAVYVKGRLSLESVPKQRGNLCCKCGENE